ncbi:hypothetical protein RhiirA4_488123 [Rhizophagus irregularis]|uniref:Uncharacterized protein n=1 Tax=Rhizophagus irregularis TaxID=588596 RepID=A0A2I1HTF3_9GLOM|nr:hypothetical protein RhiirA4_488123 [Rhizophagus irregularis]
MFSDIAFHNKFYTLEIIDSEIHVLIPWDGYVQLAEVLFLGIGVIIKHFVIEDNDGNKITMDKK